MPRKPLHYNMYWVCRGKIMSVYNNLPTSSNKVIANNCLHLKVLWVSYVLINNKVWVGYSFYATQNMVAFWPMTWAWVKPYKPFRYSCTPRNKKLPPLILQPLVENAVKHGVEPSPTGATVRISTHRRGSIVVIKVTNTVPGGTGKRGNGLALDNVRQRLNLLHDVQCRFQSALVNGVFQVRLEIPV